MRNILKIIAGDFKRLTSSVVAIVILMGICIVPCLFTWFNIFSNWDPFEPEATGRIPVAVVNDDEGADMLGLHVNVGDMMTEKLAGIDMIGWQFIDDKEKALEKTRAGDCYATFVIPEGFSRELMSVTTGELEHPKLEYYTNEKTNAIAPKITDKVRTTLEEEVDAVFVGTIGKYVTEAGDAADALGLEPEDVFGDLGETMDDLNRDLDGVIALVGAAAGISDAANDLLKASNSLISSSENALNAGENLLDAGEEALPDKKEQKSVAAAIRKEAKIIAKGLGQLEADLSEVSGDMDTFNDFVQEDLQANMKIVKEMQQSADKVAKKLSDLGLTGLAGKFEKLSKRLGKIYKKLSTLEKADETTWPVMQETVESLLKDIRAAERRARKIGNETTDELDKKINKAITDVAQTISGVRTALSDMYGDLNTLDAGLSGSEKSLASLGGGLDKTVQTLVSMQDGFRNLSELFESLSDSDVLKDVNHLIKTDAEVIAERLGAPIQMKTEEVYPIKNFGSEMASFYTALAQWIGAVFAAVMMSVQIRRRELLSQMRLHERFFGRLRLFLMIGLIQALIVSLGDLLYVGIQCLHPVLFVLAACVNSIVFMLIIYSLVFALENIGLALGVVFMILQVAGAGGIFPPEILPHAFRVMYHFMPLHYAIDAMRECVGGMYDGTYIRNLGILMLFAAFFVLLGLLLYKPMRGIIEIVEKSKEECDLML